MATKCFCDNCGSEGAGRVIISVARSEPLYMTNEGKDMDGDLCQKCFNETLSAIRSLKITNPFIRQLANQNKGKCK